MSKLGSLRENLDLVESKIQEALRIAGRKREEITLIAVTKRHPSEIVGELLKLGVLNIGESYVQEALTKQAEIALLKNEYKDILWHMIGHVQSRKAAQVAANFNMLHSVDSMKLASRLNKAAAHSKRIFPVLIQVNVSGEQSKFGFDAADEKEWQALLSDIGELIGFENLEIRGLMSILPFDINDNVAREMFSKTRNLRDYFHQQFPNQQWDGLSMGMSGDFENAILEGSTMLRLGSIILGPRPTI